MDIFDWVEYGFILLLSIDSQADGGHTQHLFSSEFLCHSHVFLHFNQFQYFKYTTMRFSKYCSGVTSLISQCLTGSYVEC